MTTPVGNAGHNLCHQMIESSYVMGAKEPESRICFVLPYSGEDGHVHYDHVRALAEAVGKRGSYPARYVALGESDRGEPSRLARSARSPMRVARAIRALWKARTDGYEYFFVHYSYLGVLASRLVTATRGGRTLYWHCGEPWLYGREDPAASGPLLRWTLRSADLVLTGSERLRRGYIKHMGVPEDRIAVLPSWIRPMKTPGLAKSAARKRLGLRAGVPLVLFAHRLSADRGCLLLAETHRAILKRLPNARLVVAGDGPDRAEVERSVYELGLSARVLFKGWIEHRRMVDYYRACDVLIVPSLRAGVPRNILEAMSAGLPVVAADVGGTADVLRGELAWCLTRPRDVEGMARKLVSLLENRDVRRRMVRGGQIQSVGHEVMRVARSLADIMGTFGA